MQLSSLSCADLHIYHFYKTPVIQWNYQVKMKGFLSMFTFLRGLLWPNF